MSLRAVFFDYSGTLFRLEQDASWLAGLTDGSGDPLTLEAQTELLRRLTAPTGRVVEFEPEFQEAWDQRDLDPEMHRKSNIEVLRLSGVSTAEQAEALYARLVDPLSWTPYPDTAEVLRGLRDAGVGIGVISNIAFDIRPAFEKLGVFDLVDEYLMSYVEGVIKPDPKLFLRACERLGVEPAEALMIGDSEEADGGAAAIGCAVSIVEPLPTAQRPDALLAAVAEHGVLPASPAGA
ncbi:MULTISPECIES: HAD family hydrolase [unclassified Saccharopolyspora]|uniref:HAD family hydrolase n=1 Tax=unclassified Saccharopolyspora TaxID=2646250 RepID=UPI001CD45D6A|nr:MULTISPECIES: HAD-IA family hydrolase [unclassified Saccharopolyspora]MCA1188634.1 HAD-IA family hydrolase [Saccharopolyspora sp. 6T]MCA1193161.1 HAD-IA family hydrolase [Saccharopolyspora sp. 6V]MCA1227864.1 HAD-IA family hydrolase [Saccharopolyspora sp. 6M]MCA1281986.1 HAD-IA family hydrolase [Saccharopolyspora sp. 7B]